MEARLKHKNSTLDSLLSIAVFLSEGFGIAARTNRTSFRGVSEYQRFSTYKLWSWKSDILKDNKGGDRKLQWKC